MRKIPMSLRKKVAYNTAYSFGSRVFGSVLALVSLGITTRYLGKYGFGEYSIVFSFLYTFNVLADFGLYSVLSREISKPEIFDDKEAESRVVSDIFSFRLLLLVLFFGLSSVLIWFFPYSTEVKIGVLAGSFHFIFLSLSQVLMGVLQKKLVVYKAALAEMVTRTVHLLLTVLFARLLLGFYWFIFIMVVAGFVNFILVVFFVNKHSPIYLSFHKQRIVKIFKESSPLFLALSLNFLYFKFDTIILSLMKSSEDVGIYNAAYKILENIIFFPAAFVGLVIPVLTKSFYGDRKSFNKIFQKSFDLLVIFGLPVSVGGAVLSEQIVSLVGGSNFIQSAVPMRLLMPAIFFIFIGTLYGNILITAGKQKYLIFIYAAVALFSVLANIIFIPRYSYAASALITSFSEFLITFLLIFSFLKISTFQPSVNALLKSAAASIVMFFTLFFIRPYGIFYTFFTGILVYFMVAYFIGLIKKEEMTVFFKQAKV